MPGSGRLGQTEQIGQHPNIHAMISQRINNQYAVRFGQSALELSVEVGDFIT